MLIRPEQPTDQDAIFAIHSAAFETTAEAKLVDALRQRATPVISLVAEIDDDVFGHVLFSPATLVEDSEILLMGLAPLAVRPDVRRAGIGSALVRAGLEICQQQHVAAVIVLGEPDFYARFGFEPAEQFGIESEYDVPTKYFMLRELQPGVLCHKTGKARYHPAFAEL